jgi:hypothetical protein
MQSVIFLALIYLQTCLHLVSSLEIAPSYTFRPFFVDSVFVIVIESTQRAASGDLSFASDSIGVYPFSEIDTFLLSFGDVDDRDYLLSQSPNYIYQKMLHSRCFCSTTLAQSLAYLDILLGGEYGTNPDCQNFILHQDDLNNVNHWMEIFGQNIVDKLLQSQKRYSNYDIDSTLFDLYFVPIGFPQAFLVQEFNSHNLFPNIPTYLSMNNQTDTPANCVYHNAHVVEKLFMDHFFSVHSLPQCPYPSESYCCFLQQHNFSDIARKSQCIYHPEWVTAAPTSSRRRPSAVPTPLPSSPLSSEDVLDASATGQFFYLEEQLHTMEQAGISVEGHHQQGQLDNYSNDMVTKVVSFLDNSELLLEVENSCFFFPTVGLRDFVDFGADPVPAFRNLYIHEAAPQDVSILVAWSCDVLGCMLC